ncbi:MAG: FAD binding domain-containing protein [Acidimicrobiales bacterium]|jgi:CO/xanthine dehydrogenase FAD-binding subunit|nr:FAD binding domain-containing protein [Acidimicrobiales bacterium]
MTKIISYQRPGNLEEALSLLSLDKHVPLAGGTLLNTSEDNEPLHFVDLQGLPLKGIKRSNGKLTIGSMVTLDEIMKNSDCPDSIRRSSRSELPSTLRTLATIGGTVASGDSDSQLIASLLVHDAEITILNSSDGELSIPLQEVLIKPEGLASELIMSIDLDTDGECVMEATGRTPADTPIVSVTARRCSGGDRMAVTGVASTPVLVDSENPTVSLQPSSDFRGDSEYRMHLVKILASRALDLLNGGK